MEELQSTELLDREILEDARKKAYRILKSADDMVKANAAEWEAKIRLTVDELKAKYAERRKFAEAEIMARLPIDKCRARAEKIENLLGSAVENWYAGLGREQVLSLLEKGLAKRLVQCGEFFPGAGRCRAVIRNLSRDEGEAILRKVLPGIAYSMNEQSASEIYPEITLENEAVRITSSIQKTVDFFLHDKRSELIFALLGGEEAL